MDNSNVHVRVGTPADFDRVLALLIDMHAETGIGPLDLAHAVPVIRKGLARDRAIVGIAEDGGHTAGSVGLFIGRWWYGGDDIASQHLEDCWNYVRPDFRRRPIARPLIEFAKNAADRIGIPLLMGVLTDSRTEAKVRLYARQMPQIGALYLHRPALAEGTHNV